HLAFIFSHGLHTHQMHLHLSQAANVAQQYPILHDLLVSERNMITSLMMHDNDIAKTKGAIRTQED
ncbi:hypothetical protein ACJX0J_032964, partial [Zea mays]